MGVEVSPVSISFGHDIADAGTKLEAVAAKAEGMMQPGNLGRGAHDRDIVRQVALNPAPDADDIEPVEGGNNPRDLRELRERVLRFDEGTAGIEVWQGAIAAAEDDLPSASPAAGKRPHA